MDGEIRLDGSYTMNWKDYADMGFEGGRFRYLGLLVAGPD